MTKEVQGSIPSIFDNPPLDQWAECKIVVDGKVIESFRVPFTQTELDEIESARSKLTEGDFFTGYFNGGPERKHRFRFRIPYSHGLDSRARAIEMLQSSADEANRILEENNFTPGLNSRQAVIDIRDALASFL